MPSRNAGFLRPRRHGVTTITIRDAPLNHPFDKELRRGAVLSANWHRSCVTTMTNTHQEATHASSGSLASRARHTRRRGGSRVDHPVGAAAGACALLRRCGDAGGARAGAGAVRAGAPLLDAAVSVLSDRVHGLHDR